MQKIECGNNFEYLLLEDKSFVNTDYRVLQSQVNGPFVPCMKVLRNGKISIYYVTDGYISFSSLFTDITPDKFVSIISNMILNIIAVKSNGFLSCANIDTSWDNVYVEQESLKVKLVYVPVNIRQYANNAQFESELRSNIVKLANQVLTSSNERLEKFIIDLCNGSMSLEDVYERLHNVGVSTTESVQNRNNTNQNNVVEGNIKLVAMNAPCYFEVIVDKEYTVLGKKQELVDVVIPFNKMISRKHCSIVKNSGSYFILDEGSANGTYVNRVRLTPGQTQEIKKGDIVRLADSDFQIV